MKKLLSLLGALGMLATTSSTVIACNHRKTPLRAVLPKTELDFLHVESTKRPEGEIPEDILEEIPEQKPQEGEQLEVTYDFSWPIIKRLLEINQKNKINPFELYVNRPTLMNKMGDMKATVAVLDSSKTYEGQIEVTFKVDIDTTFLIRETNLGEFHANDREKFEIVKGVPEIKDDYLVQRLIELNPILNDQRFENKIKRKTDKTPWNEQERTGQVEIIIEGYQGSVIVTYSALQEIHDLIKNPKLGLAISDAEIISQEEIERLLIDQLYLLNAEGLAEIERDRIHILDYDENFGWGTIAIDKVYGHTLVNYFCRFLPSEANVITDIGEVRGVWNNESVYLKWQIVNYRLVNEFLTAHYTMKRIDEHHVELKIFYGLKNWTFTLSFVDAEPHKS